MGQILTLQAPIFIAVINVSPHAYWEQVTNNLTAVFEVTLIVVALSKALLYRKPSINTTSIITVKLFVTTA